MQINRDLKLSRIVDMLTVARNSARALRDDMLIYLIEMALLDARTRKTS